MKAAITFAMPERPTASCHPTMSASRQAQKKRPWQKFGKVFAVLFNK
jgi:hypothetical protein